jgi:DNA-directed RNA polymerase subunit RPC12/RpoP
MMQLHHIAQFTNIGIFAVLFGLVFVNSWRGKRNKIFDTEKNWRSYLKRNYAIGVGVVAATAINMVDTGIDYLLRGRDFDLWIFWFNVIILPVYVRYSLTPSYNKLFTKRFSETSIFYYIGVDKKHFLRHNKRFNDDDVETRCYDCGREIVLPGKYITEAIVKNARMACYKCGMKHKKILEEKTVKSNSEKPDK